MTIRKTDVGYQSYRVTSPLGYQDLDKKVSSSMLKTMVAKAKADPKLGKLGAAVLEKAYADAKAKKGSDPTRAEVRAQITRSNSSLINETAKGRVNDGYIDSREASLLKTETAAALFKFYDQGPVSRSAPTPARELKARASLAQISSAVRTLLPIVDKGFKAYDPNNDDDGMGLSKAMRQAAIDAGLSPAARATLLTAVNGATSRGDGDSGPSAKSVKALITNAQAKLRDSDGAEVVDFARPDKKPASKKDGVITGLEVDRTPSAQGKTLRALLEYAQSL
jgi:hypothetical protein